MAKVLHNHTAGNARATAAQRCRLVGVVITACVDHYRAALNVGHAEMWRRSGLRSFAAGIDGKYWHIALVTLALRPEMFAGVSRVVMSPRCHPSRWLAIWSVGGTAIRINVDMKTVVARRQLGKLRRDPQSLICVRQFNRADLFAYAVGIDRIHCHRCAGGIGGAHGTDKKDGDQFQNASFHRILPRIRMPAFVEIKLAQEILFPAAYTAKRSGQTQRRAKAHALVHHDGRADRDPTVQVDNVVVDEPDTAKCHGGPDRVRGISAIDARNVIVELQHASAERITRTAGQYPGPGEVLFHHFRWCFPLRPLRLAGDVAQPGQLNALLANSHGVTQCDVVWLNEIQETLRFIDNDSADRL